MWQDATTKVGFRNVGALSDCSIILYVMTERWPESRKYRDMFEAVKRSVLEAIEEGKHIARTAVTTLKGDMQASLRDLPADTTMESVSDDLEQMISDMTGESIPFWTGADVSMNDGQDFGDMVDPNMEIYDAQPEAWNHNTWIGSNFILST
jgi:hypothetical protein